MRFALPLVMIASLAGPSKLGPYTPPSRIFWTDAVMRGVVRDDPPAAQKPLTRKQRAAVGAVIGSILGAIGASTVGQEMCLDHPRWTCAVLGGAEGGAMGAAIGWRYK